jgi:hypothetical protein
MRIRTLALAGLALAVCTPALAAPPQQATIQIDQQNAGIDGITGSGWTTVKIKTDKAVGVALAQLKPGKDTGVFANTVDEMPIDEITPWGKWVASGNAAPGQPYITTLELPPAWYSVVVFDGDRQYQAGGFTVKDIATSAEEPAAAATVSMRDYRFSMPATLPTSGAIKIVNDGRRLHELVIGRIKGKPAAAVKLAKQGKFGKIKFASRPRGLLGPVSPRTTNIVETNFAKGRYLLFCAYGDKHSRNKPHTALGMTRVITVR